MSLLSWLEPFGYSHARRRHRHHHGYRHPWHLLLRVETRGQREQRVRIFVIRPNEETEIMSAVNVGHTINYTWQFVDANGNPPPAGTPPPVANSATFSDTPASPPVDTFTPSGGPVEQSASLIATAAGSDTVTLSVAYTPPGASAPVTFTATDLVTISAAPFAPAGVQLIPTVQ
jgi:hypothetical protein